MLKVIHYMVGIIIKSRCDIKHIILYNYSMRNPCVISRCQGYKRVIKVIVPSGIV